MLPYYNTYNYYNSLCQVVQVKQKIIPQFSKDSELMEFFGTLTPSIAEKVAFFEKCWIEWGEDHEITLVHREDTQGVYRYLRFVLSIGRFDFVRRGMQMRFRHKEDLLLVKLQRQSQKK